MVIYGIFIMAVGKAAMHRSYLYPHNPTFGALSQGRARFFCAKAGAALLFQHKLCWARELRSNTPCPGSTSSCTDCLVHTNRAGGSPLTDGGVFAQPQLECAAYGGGNVPRPAAGQEGRHQGFYPLNSHFLLGESGADCRYVTASKKEYGRGFFLPQGSTVCSPVETYSQGRLPYCYTYGFISAGRDITVSRKSRAHYDRQSHEDKLYQTPNSQVPSVTTR